MDGLGSGRLALFVLAGEAIGDEIVCFVHHFSRLPRPNGGKH
jgi:hypothetical protein